MHPIEQKVNLLLETICEGKASISEELIQEFGERCKNVMRESFLEKPKEDKRWGLRMSNIGRPLRQLMLDRVSGGNWTPSREFKLKATVGHIYEAFMLTLLKAAGVNVEDHDTRVKLDVGPLTIPGTYDVKIDGKIYDLKTASDYAYKNKFNTLDNLYNGDAFGYFAQGFGYSFAANAPFGGWLAINKNTGEFKVLDIPVDKHDALAKEFKAEIEYKVDYLLDTKNPIPPCTGVVDEFFRRKPTGNKILNADCQWCAHKGTCHKELTCLPEVFSGAAERKLKYYVGPINYSKRD